MAPSRIRPRKVLPSPMYWAVFFFSCVLIASTRTGTHAFAPAETKNPAKLLPFIQQGRKLIIYHGTSDPAIPAARSVLFYDQLVVTPRHDVHPWMTHRTFDQGDVDFGLIPLLDDKAAKQETSGADEAATIAVIKHTLGERVSDVRASQRLTTSASCLVAGSHGPDRELERLLSQQSRGNRTKPILEINLRHPLVAAIAGSGSDKANADDLSLLLLEQAQILDGELPEDPAASANRRLSIVLLREAPPAPPGHVLVP